MKYDAFISYSHAPDSALAAAIQLGLERLAKPWQRRQALSIFRDSSSQGLTPELWTAITLALDESEWLAVLLSPASSESEWVNKEVEYWLDNNEYGSSRILLVLTNGNLQWDAAKNDFMLESSDALPSPLVGAFEAEPLHLDLRWAHEESGEDTPVDLDLSHPRFRSAVADIAGPIHGLDRSELDSEALRQERRTKRYRNGAVAALSTLAIAATGLAVAATIFAGVANRQTALAETEAERAGVEEQRANNEADNARTQASIAQAEEQRANNEADNARTQASIAQVEEQRADNEADNARTQASIAQVEEQRANNEADNARTQASIAQLEEQRANNEADNARTQASIARSEEARANAETDKANARAMSAQAQLIIARNPALAALMASTAWRASESPTPEAFSALVNASQAFEASLNPSTPPFPLTADIETAAYSPDGMLLATGHDELLGMARVWNVETGEQVGQDMWAGTFNVHEVHFNHDGTVLATVGGEAILRLWDPLTGEQLGGGDLDRLRPNLPDARGSIAFHPNDTFLVIGSGDSSVNIWDLAANQLAVRLDGHEDAVLDIDLTIDGSTIASASSDDTVRLWDVSSRAQVGPVLRGHQADVIDLAFSTDGGLLASASEDNTVRIWDARTFTQVGSPITSGDGTPTSLIWLPGTRILTIGNSDGTMLTWDIDAGVQIGQTLLAHDASVWQLHMDPSGAILLSTGGDGELRFWSTDVDKAIRTTLPSLGAPATTLTFSRDGSLLVAGHENGLVAFWNRKEEKWETQTINAMGEVYALGFNSDETRIAISTSENLEVWQTFPHTFVARQPASRFAEAVSFAASDSRLVATGSVIELWDAVSLTEEREPVLSDTGPVTATAISPDGSVVARAEGDPTRPSLTAKIIEFWNPLTGTEIRRTPGSHSLNARAMAFDHSGKTVASTGNDDTVMLWDVDTATQLGSTMTGHQQPPLALAFAEPLPILASAGFGDTLRYWATTSTAPVGSPIPVHETVHDLSFASSDSALAVLVGQQIELWRHLDPEFVCASTRPFLDDQQIAGALTPGYDAPC